MSTFILVPGGWHGGWYFQPVADTLRRHGHTAHSVTLTGLGDHTRAAPAAAASAPAATATATNLDTHIEDVLALLESDDIRDAVLVGHSYAGMVITGAAARAAGRIRRLVYADAYVPADGESCYELTSPAYRELFLEGAKADGLNVPPPTHLDPRTAPHPLASFLQRLRLESEPEVEHRDYVYLSGWADRSPFTAVYERLRRDPGWHVHSLPTGHNIAREAAAELVHILLEDKV